MTADVQTILVLAAVLVAAAYVLRVVFRTLGGRKSCASGCGACPTGANASADGPRLVSLGDANGQAAPRQP